MKTSDEIIKKIKQLTESHRKNTINGKIKLLTPEEVGQLEHFLKKYGDNKEEYFSKETFGELLTILINRKTEALAGYLFDDLEQFFEITKGHMELFKQWKTLKLDSDNHFSATYQYFNEFEQVYQAIKDKDKKIQTTIVSDIFNASSINTYLRYTNTILSFESKHRLDYNFLTQIKTERGRDAFLGMINIINDPNNLSSEAFNGQPDSVKHIASALQELLVKTTHIHDEEAIVFYHEHLKNLMEMKHHKLTNHYLDHVNGQSAKLHSYNITYHLKQLNKGLSSVSDKITKPLNDFIAKCTFEERKDTEKHNDFLNLKTWFITSALQDMHIDWVKAANMLDKMTLRELQQSLKLEAIDKKYRGNVVYERLQKILPLSILQDEEQLKSVIEYATYQGKAFAIEILHQDGIWNYDNFHKVVFYESQNHNSIYSATGLYLAKTIKELYLGGNAKNILSTIQAIFVDLEKRYKKKVWNAQLFPFEMEKVFRVIKRLCIDELFARDDFLEIMRATLEAVLNRPFHTNYLNVAVQCCITMQASTNDFLNIIDSMCIITSHEPFRKCFGDGFLKYYENPTIDEKDKEQLFKALLEHVEHMKNERSNPNVNYSKSNAMFFFKNDHKHQDFDKTQYLEQEPGIHYKYKSFKPRLFSFDNDIYPKSKFVSSKGDVSFKFN